MKLISLTVKVTLTVLVGYAIAVGAVFFLQRKLMYFPGGDLPTPAAAGVPEMEVVRLDTADGLTLTSWYGRATSGMPTVVFFHGNRGRISSRAFKAHLLMTAGYGVMLVEYRGYGGNPGRADEDGLYADGRAALDYLASQGVAAERLVLFGESLGTGVAVQLASERPSAGLILEAPFTSATDIAAGVYWFLPVRLLMLDRFESLDKIKNVDAPVLVFQGERDRVIPVEHGKRLFAAANEPKHAVIFPRSGHNDLYDHGAGTAVLEFLARLPETRK